MSSNLKCLNIYHIIEDVYTSDCEMIMVHDLVQRWIHLWTIDVDSQLPIGSKKLHLSCRINFEPLFQSEKT
jgi:hypothetical protein